MNDHDSITTKIGALTVTVTGPGSAEAAKRLFSKPPVPRPVGVMGSTLFGTHAVALALGVSRQCVWKWARDGTLPTPFAVTTGGQKRWRADAIEHFAANPPTGRIKQHIKPCPPELAVRKMKVTVQWVRERSDGCEMYFVDVDDGRKEYRLKVIRLPNGYLSILPPTLGTPAVWDLLSEEIDRCRAATYAVSE